MLQQFNSEYDYCAFISFTSHDVKVATWLKRKLDKYNIPSFVRKKHNIYNKKLKPSYTYLHASEAGGELLAELEKKLIRSRYLIIVCSPNYIASDICNWEVETFIKLGRKDYIIPIIASGTPYSDDPKEECICEALRNTFPKSNNTTEDKQIKCANLNEKGISFLEKKEHAFIQIIARILGVNFDRLWTKTHNKNIIKYIAISIMLILTSAIFLQIFNYYKTSYEYYADYEDCNGVPVGIIPLDKSDIAIRPYYYRFEISKNQVDRVVYCDAHGHPTEHGSTDRDTRPSIIEVIHENSGKICIIKKNHVGKFLHEESFSSNRMIMQLSTRGGNMSVLQPGHSNASISQQGYTGGSLSGLVDFNQIIQNARSQISCHKLDRDAYGYITKRWYMKSDRGEQACDSEGIYGIGYERDSLHRIVEIYFLSEDGESAVSNGYGIASKRFEYDKYGYISECSYHDINGKLIRNELGYAKTKSIIEGEFDREETSYYDEYDNKCLNLGGFHKETSYIKNGLIYRVEFRDIDNQLTTSYSIPTVGFAGGYAIEEYEYYDDGRLKSETFYNKDSKRCYNNNGVSRIEYEYNNGIVNSLSYYNTDDERCCCNAGYSKEVKTFDTNGNVMLWSFYNTCDKIIDNRYGYAKIQQTYSENNLLISQCFYNVFGFKQGNPSIGGAASVEYKYDKNWNLKSYILQDANNQLLTSMELIWNDDGQITDIIYISPDGKTKQLHANLKMASIKLFYNENGSLQKDLYYDEDDDPCYNNEGCAGKKYTYNSKNQRVRVDCLDLDGKRFKNDSMCIPVVRYKYENNQIVSTKFYFNADSAITYHKTGFHEERHTYNKRRLCTKTEYYDTNGEKIDNIYEFHKISTEYNADNLMTKRSYFNTENSLVETEQNFLVSPEYGDIFYGAIIEVDYTEFRKPSEIRQYGADGKLRRDSVGLYAIGRYEYDDLNRLISASYYDENQEPCNHVNGYHKILNIYDENSLLFSRICYDKENYLIRQPNCNYALYEQEYDDNGKPVTWRCYDIDKHLQSCWIQIEADRGKTYIVFVERNGSKYVIKQIVDMHRKIIDEESYDFAEILKVQHNFDLDSEHIWVDTSSDGI